MEQEIRGVKQPRKRQRIADYRKTTLRHSGHVYSDLAREAGVTYSMADKWVNGRRNSGACERAFVMLTGKPAWLEDAA